MKLFREKPIEGTQTVVRVPADAGSGQTANIRSDANLQVGSKVTVSISGGGRTTGTVTEDHGASGRFVNKVHDVTRPGNERESNLGRGQYQIEID